jgi:hypothetical protein
MTGCNYSSNKEINTARNNILPKHFAFILHLLLSVTELCNYEAEENLIIFHGLLKKKQRINFSCHRVVYFTSLYLFNNAVSSLDYITQND